MDFGICTRVLMNKFIDSMMSEEIIFCIDILGFHDERSDSYTKHTEYYHAWV
jgi:hypothetical protein